MLHSDNQGNPNEVFFNQMERGGGSSLPGLDGSGVMPDQKVLLILDMVHNNLQGADINCTHALMRTFQDNFACEVLPGMGLGEGESPHQRKQPCLGLNISSFFVRDDPG